MDQINTLFTNLLNVGTGVGVAAAAFFVMWGAFLYMAAAGNPHQMERGKAAIVNALADIGFDGWAQLETVSPSGVVADDMVVNLKYVRGLMAERRTM